MSSIPVGSGLLVMRTKSDGASESSGLEIDACGFPCRPGRHRDGVGEGSISAAVAAEILLADLVRTAGVPGFVAVEQVTAIGTTDVELQPLAGIKAADLGVRKSQVAADRDGVDLMRAEIGHRYEVVDCVPL